MERELNLKLVTTSTNNQISLSMRPHYFKANISGSEDSNQFS